MLLDGNLKQFPLPEVLLFLGPRTGRLRLYDVPKYAMMDLDLSQGQAHSLHLGGIQLTEMNEIVAELSVIVETGDGRFEFLDEQVASVPREQPLLINDLVMAMVVQVDQKLSQKRAALLPEDANAEDAGKCMLLFHLPEGYTPLRERINHYVEIARAAAEINANEPAQALQSDAARGPLTAWSVDQIQKLLEEIELRRYLRTQTIYEYQPDGKWRPLCEEYFVSFEDLKRDRFPRLELAAPEHLFLELCRALDQNLLAELALHFETIAGRHVLFNLSVASIMGTVFAQFCRSVPKGQRSLIGFELHRGDLLQDFSQTLNAMMTLHREGFKVAIDSVTPNMANYINLAAFEADFIKINVSQDRAEQLADPAIREGLARVPKEKLIFFRCDNDRALAAGLAMGVSKFQGWLIDDAVQQGRGA